jgi:hypothetical protein
LRLGDVLDALAQALVEAGAMHCTSLTGGLMNCFGKLALLGVIAALGAPATALAKILHFKGKATGVGAAPHMTITFDVTSSKGRATRIANVYVSNADYACQMGGRFERNVRLFDAGAVSKSGKFEIRETQLPPGYDNWFHGTVILPKTRNGKRTPLRVKGFLSSEFGFGLMRGEYNCVAADYFTATRVGG